MAKKAHKGCEYDSLLYRKVAKEMAKIKEEEWCHYSGMPSPKLYENEHKSKRGKNK